MARAERRRSTAPSPAARQWPLWCARLAGAPALALPGPVLAYVLAVPALGVAVLGWLLAGGVAEDGDGLRAGDLSTFLALLVAAAATVEIGRLVNGPAGVCKKDLLSAWWLPMAVLLPPAYVLVAPAVLTAATHWRVRRTPIHRQVFTAAAIGLAQAGASAVLHALPGSARPLTDRMSTHPGATLAAIAAAGVGASVLNFLLVALAAKAGDPQLRWRELCWDGEDILVDGVELCTGVLVAVGAAISPLVALVALPPVYLLQRSLLHAQLRNAVRFDAKTGLLNGVTWEREAAGDLSRSLRGRRSVAVLLVDIDHFKAVNDNHGHLAGDVVLRGVADILKAQLREGDLIGRFGGEEFAILLPETGEQEALRVAERLRARVAQLVTPLTPQAAARVSVSIGVVVADRPGPTLTDLLAAADSALYRAKAAGRDQVGEAPRILAS